MKKGVVVLEGKGGVGGRLKERTAWVIPSQPTLLRLPGVYPVQIARSLKSFIFEGVPP